jgi:hypothetical protein
VHIVGVGTCVVNASQIGSTNYEDSTLAQQFEITAIPVIASTTPASLQFAVSNDNASRLSVNLGSAQPYTVYASADYYDSENQYASTTLRGFVTHGYMLSITARSATNTIDNGYEDGTEIPDAHSSATVVTSSTGSESTYEQIKVVTGVVQQSATSDSAVDSWLVDLPLARFIRDPNDVDIDLDTLWTIIFTATPQAGSDPVIVSSVQVNVLKIPPGGIPGASN